MAQIDTPVNNDNWNDPSRFRVVAGQRLPRDTILDIDDDTWLIGNRLLLKRHATNSPQCLWDDGKGSYFSLVEADESTIKASAALSVSTSFPATNDENPTGSEYSFDLGGAILTVIFLENFIGRLGHVINGIRPGTREHVTLKAVEEMQPSFAIPRVLYHEEWDGRYYIIKTKLPGISLDAAWLRLSAEAKERYTSKVAEICIELSAKQGAFIGGVDGSHLYDRFLEGLPTRNACSPAKLRAAAEELGMDCTAFYFQNCQLAPIHVFIREDAEDWIGIKQWNRAGFIPKQWIATRFDVDRSYVLRSVYWEHGGKPGIEMHEYELGVSKKLHAAGFPDHLGKYDAFLRKQRAEYNDNEEKNKTVDR